MTVRKREGRGGKKRRRKERRGGQGTEGKVRGEDRQEEQNRIRIWGTHIVCYEEGKSEKQMLKTSLYLFYLFFYVYDITHSG